MFTVTSKSDKSNYIYVQGSRVTTDKNDASGLILQNYNLDQAAKKNLASITSRITHLTDSNYAGDLVFKTLSNDILDEKMRIDARGFLGLNTEEPEELLTVNGNTYVRSNLYVDHDIKTSKLIFEPSGNTVRSLDADAFANISPPFMYEDERNMNNMHFSRELPTTLEKNKDTTLKCVHVSSSRDIITQQEDTWCQRSDIPLSLEKGKRYVICITFQLENPQTDSNYAQIQCKMGDRIISESLEYVPVHSDESTQDKTIKASPIKTINVLFEKTDDAPDSLCLAFKSALPSKNMAIGYVFFKVDEVVN